MLNGRQIRQACDLLEWEIVTLSMMANVSLDVALRAKHPDAIPSITISQAGQIQAAFSAAGVRFGRNGAVLMALRASN